MTLILALETSCDETAAALVRDGRDVLSNVIASQVALHRRYGGVVPEVASREHLLKIMPVLEQALSPLQHPAEEVEAVAVTHGPGLAGSLLVGVNVAKALAFAWGKPLLGIQHLESHLYANWIGEQAEAPTFPALCLIVSGGHTGLVLMEGHGRYRQLGQTLDDAVGEAFDKAARILSLGYPGGPAIEEAAQAGQLQRYRLPRSWLRGTHDFSFSGLKTALYRLAQEERRREASLHYGPEKPKQDRPGALPRLSRAGDFAPLSDQVTADLAAAFQEAVVDVLVRKTAEAAAIHGVLEVLLAGGVAANTRLRQELALRLNVPLRVPPPALCTDNAAMVGAAAYYRLIQGEHSGLDLDVQPNLPLS
ncbi:MAG: tRNA (adenosine(37)-N6)-threonylcarbamoyltransferase complex transferase subunit TsaD [Chloroflexia bacterium]|nr:tRNA (adenosine(37)-N6)-threonylcarbamoyltransferase complex transferase subunit TsaD [Chloroflexia bacterium]